MALWILIRSDQLLSRVRLFATPWIAAHQASLSITNSRTSLRPRSIKSVMPSSHLILCHPLLLLPPIPASIRVFSNESTLRMRWPKYWSFSFSIIPFKEIPGLISFRMDWLDLLVVQGTLKSLLQHHSSKASILWHSNTPHINEWWILFTSSYEYVRECVLAALLIYISQFPEPNLTAILLLIPGTQVYVVYPRDTSFSFFEYTERWMKNKCNMLYLIGSFSFKRLYGATTKLEVWAFNSKFSISVSSYYLLWLAIMSATSPQVTLEN